MRWKKTWIDLKAKIIENKINTNKTWSDIARDLNIPERTVNMILKEEFAEVCEKSKKVQDLIDSNDDLIALADKRLKELLINPDKELTARDLVSVRDSWFKQNQLLTWWNTENVNVNYGASDILNELKNKKINPYEALAQFNDLDK